MSEAVYLDSVHTGWIGELCSYIIGPIAQWFLEQRRGRGKVHMQALSLVCRDCDAKLRSVAEAEAHGEATGHSNFEESTAAVRSNIIVQSRINPVDGVPERQHPVTGLLFVGPEAGLHQLRQDMQVRHGEKPPHSQDWSQGLQ